MPQKNTYIYISDMHPNEAETEKDTEREEARGSESERNERENLLVECPLNLPGALCRIKYLYRFC